MNIMQDKQIKKHLQNYMAQNPRLFAGLALIVKNGFVTLESKITGESRRAFLYEKGARTGARGEYDWNEAALANLTRFF